MAKIISNVPLGQSFYLMTVEDHSPSQMGQFYMLRAWDRYPVLSRPISVFDSTEETVSFLYKLVGTGTELLSQLKAEEDITLQGPLGTPFPQVSGRIALVGGGVGIAPFYLAAKQLKAQNQAAGTACQIDLFLGFSGKAILEEKYKAVADRVTVNVGGFITDELDPAGYDHIFTCGPEIMMKVLYQKCKASGVASRLKVSLENRMACGVGACLVCSCKTKSGNKKACKDGPVLSGEEVFGI